MTEMWERFSFYGTRAILILYMVAATSTGGLGWSTAKAGLVYGIYTGSAYLTGIPGGWIADNVLGARMAVVAGGICIAAGNALLGLGSSDALLFTGLVLMAIGTGLLKPNVSTMVGALYSQADIRRDAGFSIFYMGINLGATLSPLVCGWLAQRVGWRLGFWAACVGMIFGLIQYLLQQSQLGDAGQKIKKIATAAASVVEPMTRSAWLRIGATGIFFFFSAIFWAAFEQAGSSLNLFAEQLTRNEIFGFEFPSSWLQSVNAAFVILLAPVLSALWLKLADRQPSSPVKFALGLAGASAGFWVVMYAASLTGAGRVSVHWLLLVYLLHSLGELCLSPVGLNITTKLAPARVVGLMMGFWFASIAAGNYAAGFIGGSFKADATTLVPLFGWVAAVTLAASIVLLALTPFVKKLMGEVK